MEDSIPSLPAWHSAWARTPSSMEELWSDIGWLSFSVGTNSRFVWRGLPDDSFLVESSLARALRQVGIAPTEEAIRYNEERMIASARRWGLGHSEFGYASDLHLLAMMQHHGVPTRLVDVTYNPLTALWFACADPSRASSPGVLVAMAVAAVPVIETVPVVPHATYGSIADPLSYDLHRALSESQRDQLPFLVEPVVRDSRMTAQEGLFIASSTPSESAGTPMEGFPYEGSWVLLSTLLEMRDMGTRIVGSAWPSFGLLGLIISPSLKAQILPVLENSFNRTARSMYPDLAGFARENFDFAQPTVADEH